MVEAFWEAQSKAMRAYAQSGQYHTIVESRVRLTKYSTKLVVEHTCTFKTICDKLQASGHWQTVEDIDKVH